MKEQPTYEELERRVQELESIESELKHLKKEVRESENLFKSLYEKAPLGYQSLDENGHFIVVNHAWLDTLGYTQEEVVGKSFAAFLHPDWRDHFKENFPKFKAIGEILGVEFEMVKKNGDPILVSFTGKISRDEKGNFQQTHCIFNDITEHKQVENLLAFLAQSNVNPASGDFFQLLARYISETLGMGFVCIDRLDGDNLTAHTVAVYSDGKFEDNVSYALKDTPCGEVVGKHVCCFPTSIKNLFPSDVVLQQMEAESYIGVTLWSNDGRPIGLIAVIGAQPIKNRAQAELILRLVAVRASGELERKQAEESLLESEKQISSIFRSAPIGIGSVVNRLLIKVNNRLCEMTGYDEADLIGQSSRMLYLCDEDFEFVGREKYAQIADHGTGTVETRWRKHDSTIMDVLLSSTPVNLQDHSMGVTFTALDITERKRAEAERESLQVQLTQAQKMESVGRLAGGVAHDFNNMLGVIIGLADFLLMKMAPDHPFQANLTEIRKAGERSADLTQKLLAFARKQTVAPKVLDFNDTIENMLKLLGRLIGEDIDLLWKPGYGLWPVKMDPTQIDQILANLCVNARDAIGGVGKVTIETNKASFDEDYCTQHMGFVPGDYVLLAVSDNGCGMDTETISHLFEPFFTTKEMGKGTGLGLATVYGSVKQNNGFINVYSEPGQGTTFKIYLPRHAVKGAVETKEPKPQTAERGSETILLVEDEPAILRMTTMMLELLGYTVLAASTPGEALRLAQEHAGGIDLVLTDVVMPEMNGRDLAKNLLSIYPDMRRLFMSGYTADVIAHQGVLDAGVHFMQKPFSLADLKMKLREALDG
jgi:PAS domain S-box-containing protein